MKFYVMTLFPEMIRQGLHSGIIGRAAEKGIISLEVADIRDYTLDRHRKVDDYPYGGGAGMLMQAQPVYDAHKAVTGGRPVRTIYVTPQGEQFTQKKAIELSKEEELVFLCGHYEGIDERVLEEVVTDYISIGDYVLTGGELPAMVMIDAIARLIPGVLGNELSAEDESFYNDLLEYPQYSRPESWRGKKVPEVLLSGNHSKVMAWRLEQSILRTAKRRPDLYEKYEKKQQLIKQLAKNKRNNIHMMESLARGRSEILHAEGDNILICDREYKICKISAAETTSAINLAAMVPADTELIISSHPLGENPFYSQDCGRRYCECVQMLYTLKVPLPVKYKDIRQLTMEDLAYVNSRLNSIKCDTGGYTGGCNISREYTAERILSGGVYGVFVENSLSGFIGIHREGSLGMLFIEESCRRNGFAQCLEAYVVNRMLEKGQVPYMHIPKGYEKAVKLQEKLGFYKAPNPLYLYQR